ncbi:YidB family protein [Rhodoblastus sp.]|uniref:YidB family protein n=1 Tax=Rhodoblastus sp. TaxID=1962975 RepID=UPI003F9CA548
MGQFDDAVKESVPGNDFVKPLMIAAGALILGHIFGGKKEDAAPAPQLPPEGAQQASGGGLGGLLGNIASSLGGLANSQLGGALGGAAAGTAVSGGLDSLLNQFRQAGHGQAAESWVGTGQNQPISAEQINSVIGQGKIAEIAQQAGISPEQMSQLLAQALPNLIDKLTPGGKIQQG